MFFSFSFPFFPPPPPRASPFVLCRSGLVEGQCRSCSVRDSGGARVATLASFIVRQIVAKGRQRMRSSVEDAGEHLMNPCSLLPQEYRLEQWSPVLD
ncbi:hypothetical protein TNIN_302631 [Trichonephila inaurata madagascariensis]|uniref:Uncharacterized protein n=1 Tax=Trichonephila inaurata madagascariensis TaxID=2747483 RepID=A0A8X6WT62_9ARAC|nr:hypothetical protein TNIN_302631 [Trichonephila inaurata madagascariensis]